MLSVEKRNDELWAVLKPNSHLLRNIENGQLLHTSCEYLEDFAGTGKAYLTGLAFTDEPASLGTTQVHLSSQTPNEKKVIVCTGQQLNASHLSDNQKDDQGSAEQTSLLSRLVQFLKSVPETDEAPEPLPTEPDAMNKETLELFNQNLQQTEQLNSNLSQLIERLSAQNAPKGEEGLETEATEKTELSELQEQVTTLSGQVTKLTQALSQLTDEGSRLLAGQNGEEEVYL